MTILQILITLTIIAACGLPLALLIYAAICVLRGDADVDINEDTL